MENTKVVLPNTSQGAEYSRVYILKLIDSDSNVSRLRVKNLCVHESGALECVAIGGWHDDCDDDCETKCDGYIDDGPSKVFYKGNFVAQEDTD